ncbi:hypothetical protein C7B61_19885, partial [filamentous cyanobacterium CCP1]
MLTLKSIAFLPKFIHQFWAQWAVILLCFYLFFNPWISTKIDRFQSHAKNESFLNSSKITELIVVDAAIVNHKIFQFSNSHQAILLLNADQENAVSTVTQALANYTNLNALHLIGHGEEGSLQIGAEIVSLQTLDRYTDQFKQWREHLAQNADILIYGCNTASGIQGRIFLHQLHELTQADIQASDDLTGSLDLGGDWDLEVAIGQIETSLAFTPDILAKYNGVLKQIHVTTTQDAGKGSLRWAIEQANQTPEDDLIDLENINGTIFLDSSLPKIASNLLIHGNGKNQISGNHAHRILYIDRGDVTLRDLTIANGLDQGNDGQNGAGGAAGMGGGLFIGSGTVILTNVHFINDQAIGGSSTPPTAIDQANHYANTTIQSSRQK